MKSKLLFWLTVVAIVVHLIWYLLPQFEWRWLSEDQLVILSYSGFGSRLNVQPWLSWSVVGVSMSVLVVFLFLGSRVRHLLLLYWIGSLFVLVPLGGIVAETGFSMVLRDLGHIVVGAMIAIAYMSATREANEGQGASSIA